MAWPDISQEVDLVLGWPSEDACWYPVLACAGNVIYGVNPPYTATDFAAMYPKFFGMATALTLALTIASATATLSAVVQGLTVGALVVGPGIAGGTTVAAINGTTLTLSQPATMTTSSSAFAYLQPLLPLAVVSSFVYLASGSLSIGRYADMWMFVMGLFIAHYATLYLQTDGPQAQNAMAAANAGLARGIAVAKSVGDESVSYQPASGLERWGAWTLTQYGTQFASIAKVVGAVPVLFW